MRRAKGDLLAGLAAMPWPVGIMAGVGGFAALRYGLPRLLEANSFLPVLAAFAAPLSWCVLGVGLLGAMMSWVERGRRRRLLDAQRGLESVAALGWHSFERLAGEAFRRQGYAVEETGLGGADGGIDLILRKGGCRVLVQCKQWHRRRVPVSVVREMYGLLAHHDAAAVKIVASGGFTPEAERFARGKPIELIGGDAFWEMIHAVQDGSVSTEPPPFTGLREISGATGNAAAPACPRCGRAMVERRNRQTAETFWGCPGFPQCRGRRRE